VAVSDERGRIVGLGLWCRGREKRRERQEVAAATGSGRDEGEDFGYQALLDCCVLLGASAGLRQVVVVEYSGLSVAYQLGVELGQPGLAIVVENQYCVNHYWCLCACIVKVMTS